MFNLAAVQSYLFPQRVKPFPPLQGFFTAGETKLVEQYLHSRVDDPARGNPSSDAIRRYNAAEERLANIVINGNLTVESITSVLDAVHFEGPYVNTVYSNIFDVANGDIYLYFFHQFEEVVKLNLEEELAKGRHNYRIADLFSQEIVEKAYKEYSGYPFIIRTLPVDLLLFLGAFILDILLVSALVVILGKKTSKKYTSPREIVRVNSLQQRIGKKLIFQRMLLLLKGLTFT